MVLDSTSGWRDFGLGDFGLWMRKGMAGGGVRVKRSSARMGEFLGCGCGRAWEYVAMLGFDSAHHMLSASRMAGKAHAALTTVWDGGIGGCLVTLGK